MASTKSTFLIAIIVCTLLHINGFLTGAIAPKCLRSTCIFAGNVPLVANGKRVEAPEGSSLNAACQKLGLKIPFKCKKGDCGTCTVTIGGVKYRPCVAKVPSVPKLKSIIEKGLTVSVDNA
jgi:ferredoxin